MCFDPLTMMAVATVASTALGAAGSVMEGNAAEESAKLQDDAYRQQAQAEAQSSAFEIARENHKQELAAGAARAQVGASGVAFEGSPTAVLVAQAGEGALDIEAIKYGSKLRQNQLRTQGKISLYQGAQAKTAGYINAASTIASGVSSIYSRKVSMGGNPFT